MKFSRVDLAVLAVMLMWGANFTITKVALAEIHPLAFTLGRFLIIGAIALLSLAIFSRPIQFRNRPWGRLLLMGIIGQAIYQYCFAIGLSKTSTFHASVIISSSPIIIALLTVMTGLERLRILQWIGIFISFCGMIFFLRSGVGHSAGGASLTGDLLAMGGTLCWAVFTLLSKPLEGRERPLEITSWTILSGLPFMIPYSIGPMLEQDWNISLKAWLCFFYAAIFPIYVAYLLWIWAVHRLGTVRTSIYLYLVPIITAVLSTLWIHEPITSAQVIFGLVVISGMALTRKS